MAYKTGKLKLKVAVQKDKRKLTGTFGVKSPAQIKSIKLRDYKRRQLKKTTKIKPRKRIKRR